MYYYAAMLSFFQALDNLVATRLAPHSPTLRFLFAQLTHLAGIYFISIAGVCSVLYFAVNGSYTFALGFIVALGGSMLVALSLKRVFMRERPTDPLIRENGHALPSGHAACSFAFYGYCSYLLMKLWPSPLSFFIVILLALLVLAIGFSRVYLRVHHTSDVLLGYFIGAIFLTLAIVFF